METEFSSLTLLLVDDDPSYLQLLEILFKQLGVQKIIKATSYQSGIGQYQRFKPDLCFLDIDLKDGLKTGIDVARFIRKQNARIPIFFLTAHYQEDFYEQVKCIRPNGFMDKEVSRLKLRQAIELFFLQSDTHPISPPRKRPSSLVKLPSTIAKQQSKSKALEIFFKIGDTYKAIKLEDIDYFYAENKFTYARVGNRNYPTNVQLKVLSQELNPRFLRCHKKYLINIGSIDSILTKEDKIKIGNELLPIGYAYRKLFLEQLRLMK
ncbi:MAG: LytR/AlgR family response regulator transcription factor [Lewinella sp.]|uniref:LytR/AlgR family response regulator transcription factor n=1 Tax=Lewinella sp. TaxID=2004506 RepID=UPI003D6C29C9